MEVSQSNLRREPFNNKTNDKSYRLDLDCFDEVREDALWRMTKHKKKMMKYHKQRVKLKRFNPRDIMLRKVTETTKDLTQGKLNPTWEGCTRSSSIPEEELITSSHSMVNSYLIHGM